MFTEDIIDAEENYKGKKSHFLLKLKDGKLIHLKSDTEAEMKKWVAAILTLGIFYRKLGIKDRDRDFKHKDVLEISIFNAIMKEHESKVSKNCSWSANTNV
jgi:hypothetical protein